MKSNSGPEKISTNQFDNYKIRKFEDSSIAANITTLRDISKRSENFPNRIGILYFRAGNGHITTAKAMRSAIEKHHPTSQVTLIDFFEEIKGNSLFEREEGDTADVVYNRRFAEGSLADTLPQHRQLEARDAAENSQLWQSLFANKFAEHNIDFLLSVIPVYNNTVAKGLEKFNEKIPYTVLFTDYDIYREGATEPLQRSLQYAICPSDKVESYCKDLGYPDSNIFPISGLVTGSDLKYMDSATRATEKAARGLDPDKRTGIILGGGVGALDYGKIARSLESAPDDLQYIFVCGRNQLAFEELSSLQTKYPKLVLGFTDEVERLMQISDFYIGKAGGLSITEALQKNLPLLLIDAADASPLEKLNVEHMTQCGKAVSLSDVRQLGASVCDLFTSGRFDKIRQHIVETMADDPSDQVLKHISEIHQDAIAYQQEPDLAVRQKQFRTQCRSDSLFNAAA